MRAPHHTLRGRLTIAAVVSTALALIVLTATFNVLLRHSLRSDLDGRLRAHATAALATVRVGPDRLAVTESAGDAALDSGTWVYEGRTALERPQADDRVQAAADKLAGSGPRFGNEGENTRLYALPIISDGRRRGTVVAAASLAAYERSTNIALVGSALFALAILLAVAAVSWAITGAALRPVAAMTEQADEWSDHDIDQRFGSGDRPLELAQLAATFDALLDRISATLRQEQRLSAELSHELRTPLAKVVAEAELMLRRPDTTTEQREALEVIRRGGQRMTEILETLMATSRSQSGAGAPGRGDARLAARRTAEHLSPSVLDRGVTIEVAPGPPAPAGADVEVIERVLTPIVDNALRHARARVMIDISRDGEYVEMRVRDDGDGVADADLERIFFPGVSEGAHDGSGLGLALSRRLARAAGGDVRAQHGDGGDFVIELPPG